MMGAKYQLIGRRQSGQRGSFLLASLLVCLVVTLLLASAVITTAAMGRNCQFTLHNTEAKALSEGVLEVAQKEMLSNLANFKKFDLKGYLPVGPAKYPFTITAVGAPTQRIDPDGVTIAIQSYEIRSTVSIEDASSTSRRVVDVCMTPLFQYMILSDGDLEILPGPNMTLGGRVHSNSSIYIGTGPGSTLKVNTDYFRAVGDILRYRKDDRTTMDGTVLIKVFGESTFQPMLNSQQSTSPDWLKIAAELWKGTVESGAQGMKKVAIPSIQSIKAIDPSTGEKGYFHSNAGLVIRDDQALDSSGNVVPLPAGTIVGKSMYDAREGKTIKVTEIDLGLLGRSIWYPANGLLYAYRSDATKDSPNGIRLTNGKKLAGPLTVVTEDPLFIRGDFNTDEKKGAAVIADAVNLLSNAWNDTKTAGMLPNATKTAMNVAMITGNVPTESGVSYSGGFENLPRFHENWGGVDLEILGAFINIFKSEIARGKWGSANVYSPPTRKWSFDLSLLNVDGIPPYTPNAVSIQRVLWDDGLPTSLSAKETTRYKSSDDSSSNSKDH